MSYINFKGIVKKINLKSADETEITISIPAEELDGQYNTLQSMLELKVIGGLDSQIITYKVMKNALTGKPLTKYVVDNTGLVSVAQPEGEQLSMDLGLPAEKVEIKAEPVQIDLEVIQEFILSGLAPSFDDLDHDFIEITLRLSEGETYLKLAAEADMGVGVFVVMVDEYRRRVAPMAASWDEWRTGKVKSEPVVKKEEADVVSEEGEKSGHSTAENGEKDPGGEVGGSNDLEPDWLNGEKDSGADSEEGRTIGGNDSENPQGDVQGTNGTDNSHDADLSVSEEVSKEALEAFILTNRPIYDDIEIDGSPILFPELLKERLELKKTWKEIAQEKEVSPAVLSAKWGAYKKRVERKMKGDGGAA